MGKKYFLSDQAHKKRASKGGGRGIKGYLTLFAKFS